MQADVRAALDKRDHKRLRVLLQQCSGQELAAMRSPLPLYHSVAGSGWAVGTVMLAWAAMPVPAADEEDVVASRYRQWYGCSGWSAASGIAWYISRDLR